MPHTLFYGLGKKIALGPVSEALPVISVGTKIDLGAGGDQTENIFFGSFCFSSSKEKTVVGILA